MGSSKKVQNTHISARVPELHRALLDIVSVMNQPHRDEALIKAAGIALDRALFPLLVGIERFGPIGVVELADRAGRDHTTVSRQLVKLEGLGLVSRQADAVDRRVRKAIVTRKGKAMTERIDGARERIALTIFESWDKVEVDTLVDLLSKFAKAIESRKSE